MVPYWLAFPAGICIATIVTIVGFGGGIFWMPFLLIAFKMDADSAILTSLLIQTAGTGSGSIAFVRRRKADCRLALLLLAIAVPGVAVGAFIAHRLSLSHIELIIGLISLATALLFVSANRKYGEEGNERADIRTAVRHSWVAVIMAIASGMLTINIGEWLIPILQKKVFLKISNAIATCVLVTFGISLVGALIHIAMASRPDTPVLFAAVPGVLIGGQLGPWLMQRIDERFLKEVFVFVLTLIGIHLVYTSYPG
jgi:uncharacterized membrane protein YfcA